MIQLKQFKFEKLQVWDFAMDFGEKIQAISCNFPKNEMFNLQSQINRAADSVALNISEEQQEIQILSLKNFWDIQYAQ